MSDYTLISLCLSFLSHFCNELSVCIFLEPPVIQSHPSTLDVILNNHVTLPCRATGSPRPTITWQKEGINIFTTGGN